MHPYNHSTWTAVGGSLGFNGHPACLVNSQPMRDSVFALALCMCLPRASQLGLLTMTHLHRREKKDIGPALGFLSLLQVISRQCCINCLALGVSGSANGYRLGEGKQKEAPYMWPLGSHHSGYVQSCQYFYLRITHALSITIPRPCLCK